MTPGRLEAALWSAWLLYWFVAARRAAKPTWREPLTARLAHRLPLAAGAYLLLAPARKLGPLGERWLPEGAAWAGVAVTAAGLAFSAWARVHIGRYWSSEVELKQGHRLIRTGPYALARHPIYTGVLAGFLGAALALGELRGIVAFVLAFAAFWLKSRREEAALSKLFGAEYQDYRRQVKAIIPGLL